MNVLLGPFVSLVACSKLALMKPLDDLNAGKVSVKWGTEKVIYLHPKHEMLAFNSKQEQVQTKLELMKLPMPRLSSTMSITPSSQCKLQTMNFIVSLIAPNATVWLSAPHTLVLSKVPTDLTKGAG